MHPHRQKPPRVETKQSSDHVSPGVVLRLNTVRVCRRNNFRNGTIPQNRTCGGSLAHRPFIPTWQNYPLRSPPATQAVRKSTAHLAHAGHQLSDQESELRCHQPKSSSSPYMPALFRRTLVLRVDGLGADLLFSRRRPSLFSVFTGVLLLIAWVQPSTLMQLDPVGFLSQRSRK